MRAAEQEALLLRQVAALRRRGRSQLEALSLAAGGLARGELADRVARAVADLQAGRASDDLLGRDGDPRALEHAAAAIDARLAAANALLLTRLYATGAGVVVMFGLVLMGWTGEGMGQISEDIPILHGVLRVLRRVGPVVSIAVVAALWVFSARHTPGGPRLQRASALLTAAAQGTDPMPILAGQPVEQAYFEARRQRVGPGPAAAELADELTDEAKRILVWFHHLAPALAALVVGPLLFFAWLGAYALPVLRMAGSP